MPPMGSPRIAWATSYGLLPGCSFFGSILEMCTLYMIRPSGSLSLPLKSRHTAAFVTVFGTNGPYLISGARTSKTTGRYRYSLVRSGPFSTEQFRQMIVAWDRPMAPVAQLILSHKL
jgi:hypothetical protein